MRIPIVVAMLLALPSPGWADGVKLQPQTEKGLTFLAPAGWSIDILDDLSKVVATDGSKQATITMQSISKKDIAVEAWVKMMTPGGKPKVAGGWTCAESDAADKSGRTATCGQAREGLLLFVGMTAEPALYKKLGGLKLVQKVAASAQGLKAPDAGE